MALIGFILCALVLISVTAPALVIGLFTFGKWTIGGAQNSWHDRIALLIVWAVLGFLWYLLLTNAPFSVSLKAHP